MSRIYGSVLLRLRWLHNSRRSRRSQGKSSRTRKLRYASILPCGILILPVSSPPAQTLNLSKHLGFLRQSLNITPSTPSLTLEPKPAAKARRPTSDPNASPVVPRLSRAPNFPGIYEDDEMESSPEADENDVVRVTSSARRKTKDKLSSSRLPLPSRVESPPPLPTPLHINLVDRESSTKRKASRRQSGLLSINTDAGSSMGSERPEGPIHPRASSPALGSPERRNAGLAEDDEERQVGQLIGSGSGPAEELDLVARARKERKEKKLRQVERVVVHEDTDFGTLRIKERKRRKEEESSGLKDVTNSPRSRTVLPPLDTHAAGASGSSTSLVMRRI